MPAPAPWQPQHKHLTREMRDALEYTKKVSLKVFSRGRALLFDIRGRSLSPLLGKGLLAF